MQYKNFVQLLEERSKGLKGITFINDSNEEKRISYRDLYEKSQKVLHPLQERGVQEQSELILLLNDDEAFLCTIWAAFMGKIIPVPTPVGLNEEFMFKLIKIWKKLTRPYLMTSRKIFFMVSEFAKKHQLEDLLASVAERTFFYEEVAQSETYGEIKEIQPDDIAMVQFSSGSTGEPKGVVLTHKNLLVNCAAITKASNCTEDDSTLSWVPLTHDLGLIGFHLTPLLQHIEQYIMSISLFLKNPLIWLERASQHKATLLSSPNFGYKHYLSFYQRQQDMNLDLSSVRLIFNGAEPISAPLSNMFMQEMSKYGLKMNAMYPVYGLAEASLAVTFPEPTELLISHKIDRNTLTKNQKVNVLTEDHGTAVEFVDVGYPVDDMLLRIVNDENEEVGQGVIGHIQIKGASITPGYYGNPEATKKLFTPDGWCNTGDLGFMLNGRLIITGRAKDIIFVNGQNYYPHDLERVSCLVPGVEPGNIAFCSAYNEETDQEEVFAFIQFDQDIQEFVPVRNRLKSHLMKQIGINVEEVIPVPAFPKTASGKVQRFKLVEMVQMGQLTEAIRILREVAATYVEGEKEIELPRNEVEEELVAVCQEVLKVEQIGITDNLLEYGSSSMILTQMHARLETLYPGKLKITDFFEYPSIAQIADLIERNESKFSIRGQKFPVEYFGQGSEEAVFTYSIRGEMLENVHKMAKNSRVQVRDILLAGYAFLMKETTENEEVQLQVLTDYMGFLTSLQVDFNKEYADFASYFKDVHQRAQARDSKRLYSYYDLERLEIKKEKQALLPLFYEKVHVTKEVNLLDHFDLTLEVVDQGESIDLSFAFNPERLLKEQIKGLFSNYIKCIQLFIENY